MATSSLVRRPNFACRLGCMLPSIQFRCRLRDGPAAVIPRPFAKAVALGQKRLDLVLRPALFVRTYDERPDAVFIVLRIRTDPHHQSKNIAGLHLLESCYLHVSIPQNDCDAGRREESPTTTSPLDFRGPVISTRPPRFATSSRVLAGRPSGVTFQARHSAPATAFARSS